MTTRTRLRTRELPRKYAASLRDYLGRKDETALRQAYELGRQALAAGLGVLDMTRLHHEALATVSLQLPTTDGAMHAATRFFVESLTPFEMTLHGYGDMAGALRATERREAERALHAVNQRLEEEARRIAHALHDEAAQLLASIYLALDALAVDLSPPVRARLAEVRALLEQVEAQLRHFSHELRPTILDDFGLIPALQFLAEGVSKRTGLSITVMGSTGGRLSTDIETVLYRIVQEGLTNVTRHAKASRAVIDVRRDADTVVCSIDDNGQGFETSTRRAARTSTQGLGLIGIKERVAALSGTLAIRSRPGAGTTLEIAVPLRSTPCHSGSSSLTTT